jgi:hypothetical protein
MDARRIAKSLPAAAALVAFGLGEVEKESPLTQALSQRERERDFVLGGILSTG